jgi:hypothetical protein
MKFIVSTKRVPLTVSRKPCDEAREEELTALDVRDVNTLEEAKGKIWYKDWLKESENHREENGTVVSDKKIKVKQWVVELKNLEDLASFHAKHGDLLLTYSSPYKEAKQEIIIQGDKGK